MKNNIFRKIIYKLMTIAAKIIKKEQEKINFDFTLITSNCVGGMIYHKYNMKFLSPTINLKFYAEDFLKFCENLDYYLSCELTFMKRNVSEKSSYPVCLLDDIQLHFIHYNDYKECKICWERRKKRIVSNKIYIIMTDRDGFKQEMISRFENLPYPKIFYSHKPIENKPFVIYIPGFEKEESVPTITDYCDFKGNRYYEKYCDIKSWLVNN